MSFLLNWLRQCSDCFNYTDSTHENGSNNIYNLASYCLHSSNKNDRICYKCFLTFFGHDRFIIRRLFIHLNQQQQETNFVCLQEFYSFAERIITWHEVMNHIDFILLLFQIILAKNDNDLFEKTSLDSNSFYKLIEDAFFFTTLQSNTQTNLTRSSQV